MKRSDMVKLMWDFIQEVESDYDYYMTKDDTDNLLSKMEEAGIQPPASELDQDNWGVMSPSRWDEDRIPTHIEFTKEEFEEMIKEYPELLEKYMKRELK